MILIGELTITKEFLGDKKLLAQESLLEMKDNSTKFKLDDGIWKVDYYEVDRVIIEDCNGEIIIDITYTLLTVHD